MMVGLRRVQTRQSAPANNICDKMFFWPRCHLLGGAPNRSFNIGLACLAHAQWVDAELRIQAGDGIWTHEAQRETPPSCALA